jgi:hypothetical protein
MECLLIAVTMAKCLSCALRCEIQNSGGEQPCGANGSKLMLDYGLGYSAGNTFEQRIMCIVGVAEANPQLLHQFTTFKS